MLQAGRRITEFKDELHKVDIKYLYNAIKNPKPIIHSHINQLRLVESLDKERYNELKKQLPYIVCGIFTPPFRNTQNFSWIKYFIIDIDHLSLKGYDLLSMKNKLRNDERISMMFASPGNDGLKVLFTLSEKCYDSKKYSIFYKVFAKKFSEKYSLDQVLDMNTSDVTRACFISVDEDIYYNDAAIKVNMGDYLNFENNEDIDSIEKELFENSDIKPPKETAKKDKELPESVLSEIKQKLNPGRKVVKTKHVYVPEQLNEVLGDIREKFESLDIEVESVTNINYGKKITLKAKYLRAEINLFYGRKGFTVVKSFKRGTNGELCDLAKEIIESVVYS